MSQQALLLARPKTTLLSGLADVLLSSSRVPWLILDFTLLLLGYFLFYRLSPYESWVGFSAIMLQSGLVFSSVFLATGVGFGFYERRSRFGRATLLGLGIFSWLTAVCLSLLILYFGFYLQVGRIAFFLGTLGGTAFVLFVRTLLTVFLRKNPYRFVIVGTPSKITEEIVLMLQKGLGPKHYKQVSETELEQALWQQKSVEEILLKLNEERVTDIVLSEEAKREPKLIDLALKAIQAGYRVQDEISLYAEMFERLPVSQLSKDWFALSGIESRRLVQRLIKRIFDFTLATIGIVIFFPLLLLISVLILILDGWPVFFVQKRQGQYLVPFKMIKFRTMKKDHGDSNFTTHKDPRVTVLGKILRPLHFDELPQLFNILKGEMSWVGPRPEAIEFAQAMQSKIGFYEFRYFVKPGLTGLAQIYQGYAMNTEADTAEKLSYDLFYIKHHSLAWDLILLVRTAFVLVKRAR